VRPTSPDFYQYNPNGDHMLGSTVPLNVQIVKTMQKQDFTIYQIEFQWKENTWTVSNIYMIKEGGKRS
jgi:hypothetical protein